ncbi:MAG: DNA-3-methyladenine glycosylase I [bacterium]|nr:DNA-3-methyladenine glycosylase I [bacterium]MDT8367424.1 DNA-3-methyladenine glycosylase I [bacterium]
MESPLKKRCSWPEGSSDEMIAYHDEEWGVPVRENRKLFEMFSMGGAQAGLSWATILKRRTGYKKLFHNFNIKKCSLMTDAYLQEVLTDTSIIRNRLKVYSVRKNALAALEVIEEFGSLSDFLWGFVGGRPVVNRIKKMSDIPATSPESDTMAREMKKRGFTFAGSTICYAFMQGVGMVNDHEMGCWRWQECQEMENQTR